MNCPEAVKACQATGSTVECVWAAELAVVETGREWNEYCARSATGRGSYYASECVLAEEYAVACCCVDDDGNGAGCQSVEGSREAKPKVLSGYQEMTHSVGDNVCRESCRHERVAGGSSACC